MLWELPPNLCPAPHGLSRGQTDHTWCGAHLASVPTMSSHPRLPTGTSLNPPLQLFSFNSYLGQNLLPHLLAAYAENQLPKPSHPAQSLAMALPGIS